MGALTIGSNIASLGAQRRLSAASDRLSKNFERLASGLRINRASDDAAGLAIASGLRRDSRVYLQAIRNGNDAISALNIAQGSLQELTNAVIRIKELASQSANGPLSRGQRLSLDSEGKALTDEFNRIASVTGMNGLALLDGSLDRLGIQLGYGAQGSILVGLGQDLRRARGTGIGTTEQEVSTLNFGMGDVVSGDFNGDGRIDFAVTDPVTTRITLGLNNGSGGFTTSQVTPSVTSTSLVAADFNGDGILDLASGSTVSTSIMIGRGDGTFATGVTYNGAAGVQLRAGDINGDGLIDLFGISGTNSNVQMFINQGAGVFGAVQTITTSGTVTDFRLGDMDYDGRLDLVVNKTNATVGFSVLLNTGSGTFSSSITTTLGGTPGKIGLADFDYDGILDVVVARNGAIDIFKGLGNGSFQSPTSITVGNVLGDMEIADMDGDGHLDIVALKYKGVGTGDKMIIRSKGDGTFEPLASYQTVNTTTSNLVVADFNGDGVNDLMNNSTSISALTIYYSTTTYQSSLERVNLTTRQSALDALSVLDRTLLRLQREISSIGASQSRISSALNTLLSAREGSEAAAGRIQDADLAHESASLVKEQILQQAASAVLAQANQVPALALTLLGN